jgi:hypothetical protein
MPHMRRSPANTLATFPTRQFSFILDPSCLLTNEYAYFKPIFNLIHDLRLVQPRIDIDILLPTYLASSESLLQADVMNLSVKQISKSERPLSFELDDSIVKAILDRFKKKTDEIGRELALLGLSESLQADGIVTESDILLDRQYAIYQHHAIRIIPFDELADVVEVIAHGNSVFWSVSNPERRLGFDVFYQLAHWKNARYFKWHEKVRSRISDRDLAENLHSALLNRHSYVLYSRDMIRFYELQREYYRRSGLFQSFGMALGYYVNTFYLMLWGMLDQLAVIAKYARNLKVDEKYCGINSDRFWKEFITHEPELTALVKSRKIDDWIKVMADMRHHAAHKVIKIPTPLLADTEDSKKTNGQILEEIKKEKARSYQLMPKSLMEQLEPSMILQWRLRHMKVVAPSIVPIKRRNGTGYYWDPVISVDHDLAYLTALMDAFIVRLFRNL